jgi:hypothetical protein
MLLLWICDFHRKFCLWIEYSRLFVGLFWMVQWLTVEDPNFPHDSESSVFGPMGTLKSFISCLQTRIRWIVCSVSAYCFYFQNMVISRPFTSLLILTAHSLFTWYQPVEAGPPQLIPPPPLLSDEFISYINSLHTTWKVMFLRMLCTSYCLFRS